MLPSRTPSPPRLLIIGAGSRGHAYARAVSSSNVGRIVSVAEPIAFKRRELIAAYVSHSPSSASPSDPPPEDQEFDSWKDFASYEVSRRERERAGEKVLPRIDGVFVCVLDDMHREVIEGLAPLGLHIMCEKPLATTLGDCLRIYRALRGADAGGQGGEEKEGDKGKGKGIGGTAKAVFSIGHVLRYSPHNMMLRRLVLEQGVVGEVLSVEHTEPVGWWHFAHSYVRGNWRKESTTAPSLLTKSCHDIDFLLWMLCSNIDPSRPPHLPSTVSSTGALSYFKGSRKPKAAGGATNCLSCPAEPECMYSAKKIYVEHHLVGRRDTGWPVKIVEPEIEECWRVKGEGAAQEKLLAALAVDYDAATAPQEEVDARPWFGRCVYESANDVCDDQTVTMTWDDDSDGGGRAGRGAKSASFHMVAFTEKQCERRGRIYGTCGEVEYDSEQIRVYDFATGRAKEHLPKQMGGGHGGGDDGLAMQYVLAVDAVKNGGMGVEEAQREFVGCGLEEVVRSHAMVFAAEEARRGRKVVEWGEWWRVNVEEWSG